MSYTPQLAAALTGATHGQLSYWRRGPSPVLRPEVRSTRPMLYSFRDLVALRTCVFLRERVSLQRIRKALDSLDQLGEEGHLSEHTLVADGGSIILVRSPDEAIDLVRQPGQSVMAVMSDVLGEFTSGELSVPNMYHPRELITIDPDIRGGRPVVRGTRVPFESVAALVRDGVKPRDIAKYYPSVTAPAARQAKDFLDYVDSITSAA
ncbi:MAG: DUF433 domain-containing protein [Nakamurella sp.]